MDAGYDTGPIIRTQECCVLPHHTYVDVRSNIYREGAELLAETLLDMANGDLDPRMATSQPDSQGHFWPFMGADDFQRLMNVMGKKS